MRKNSVVHSVKLLILLYNIEQMSVLVTKINQIRVWQVEPKRLGRMVYHVASQLCGMLELVHRLFQQLKRKLNRKLSTV